MSKEVKKRACLIGLGLITKRYLVGLSKSTFLNLCAVADINENAVSRADYTEYPFFTDYKEMITTQKPDYAIISTPPASHYDIARFCLDNNVNVIIEKPVTLCIEDFETLQAQAKEKNLVVLTLFHWHGGIESRAFMQNYSISQIEEIKVNVSDPYCDNGEVIKHDRRILMGAWIDSGVNVLSMIRQWLPFDNVEIISAESEKCKETGMPVFAKVDLLIDGVKTEIVIDWRKGIDRKESYIKINDRLLHIDHSAQSITDGDVTEYARMQRLDEHYRYLFEELDGTSNAEFSHSVHKILFKVDEVL